MSTDQESPPAQKETITTATNKPEETADDSKAFKQDSETTSKNSPPKDALSQTTATNKPEETADDSKSLKQDSEPPDPSAKDIPQAETETTSKNSKTTEDAEALKQGSATDADPHRPEKTPSEDQTTSKDTSPTKNDSSQTTAANKQETDDTKATQPDSAAGADPHVQETASTHSSPPKNSSTQITAIRKPETDDTEAREKDSATDADPHVQPVKNESTSKDSSPPNQATATHEPETHENKILAEELPGDADPHPPVQEISPADDETTSKKSSPAPKMTGVNDPETRAAETLEEDSINDADPRPKKILPRRWKKLKNVLSLITGKPSQSKSSVGGQRTKDEVTAGPVDEKQDVSKLIQADLNDIATGAKILEQYKDQLNKDHEEASKYFENLKEHGKKEDLHELRKDMMKLKLHVPKHKVDADKKDPHKNLRFTSKTKQSISEEVLNKMPQLHNSDVLKRSMEFKDFEARCNELTCQSKLCLLCLSVLPENAIIKKRLMVHWWVAEGFASEDEANKCFVQLLEKGFIKPVNKNRSLSVGSYQMHPFNRSALVMLTERAKFFNFGARGEPTQNFLETFQACLVGKGLISFEDLKNKKLEVDDLEKLHLLINVDEHILEFKPDWFAKMRNLNFLYLGRWKALATDHIEVEDTKFLRGLGKMSCVKFLSLQGVSNIIDLPESILQLINLKILDLRACYNLETIPERIGSLKSLTHLDMSECYLLDHMPKSLSLLKELRVLKGFVVGSKEGNQSECTLDDLKILGNLTKLCIYTGSKEFPNDQHVAALEKLQKLSKLTIIWGGSALQATTANNTAENTTPEKQSSNGYRLPPTLEKLDLKCFPKSTTPNWLLFNNLKGLKKLYIRGGKLSDLGQYQDIDDCNLAWSDKKETWKVEVLRLKYLSEIEMEWRQLQELFPDLVYLEQVSCPKLTLFPCDANGVWIDKIRSKQSSGNVP